MTTGGNQIDGESIRHRLSTNEQCENIIVELKRQVLPGQYTINQLTIQ